jgi:DNA-binding NarL/FixJ family response regulator
METIQIALVDDHRLFRSGIASLINKFPQYKILFEAGDGEELSRKLTPKLKPHLILLDINMPKKDGIATAQWIRANYPEVNIIVLSMFEDAEKVLQMVKIGVKGYLLKDAEPLEFERALQSVSQGEVYFPDFVTRHLISNFNQKTDEVRLNIRELEFLKISRHRTHL